MRFVAVGDVTVAAGTADAARIDVHPGGPAVDAALAAASLGADAAVIGAVGNDAAATMVRAALAQAGVDAQLTVVESTATSTSPAVDGETRARPGTAAELPERIEADVVLVSGYLPDALVADALGRAKATWVALAATPGRLPRGADAVFANAAEAHALTGAEPKDAVRMLGTDHRLACVTLGAEGALAMLDGRIVSAQAESGGTSTLGAGFAAVMLVALLRGDDVDAALTRACAFDAAGLGSGAPMLHAPDGERQ